MANAEREDPPSRFSDYFQGFLRRLKLDNDVWSVAAPVEAADDVAFRGAVSVAHGRIHFTVALLSSRRVGLSIFDLMGRR